MSIIVPTQASLGQSGGLMASRALASDPLVDILFSFRFQTYLTKGTAIGVFSDAAGTIPAIPSNPIKNWKDVLSTSGEAYIQATTASCGILNQSGGVFYLTSDELTTAYPPISNLTTGNAVTILCRSSDGMGLRILDSSALNGLVNPYRSGLPFFVGGVVSTSNITTDGLWHTATLVCPSAGNFSAFIDGVDVTTGAVGTGNFGPVALFRGGAANEGQTCDLIAVMCYPSSYRVRVETYLANLPT
jgi:hypothetical protein